MPWAIKLQYWFNAQGFKTTNLLNAEHWLAGAFAVIVFLVPLLLTARMFIRQVRSGHYSELDRIYMELLKMSFDRTYLRDMKQIPQFVKYLKDLDRHAMDGSAPAPADTGHDEVLCPDSGASAPEPIIQTLPDATPNAAVQEIPPVVETDEFREKAMEYGVYAFMVFNFLETIHDRCDENRRLFIWPDKNLLNTWRGIIGEEYRIHLEWFAMEAMRDESENTKFCAGFIQFMLARRWLKRRWGYLSETNSRTYIQQWKGKDGNLDPHTPRRPQPHSVHATDGRTLYLKTLSRNHS